MKKKKAKKAVNKGLKDLTKSHVVQFLNNYQHGDIARVASSKYMNCHVNFVGMIIRDERNPSADKLKGLIKFNANRVKELKEVGV